MVEMEMVVTTVVYVQEKEREQNDRLIKD